MLRDKAASGVRVRIALGDPDCSEVAERERQEAIDAAVAAKIRNSLALFKELRKEPNTEFKLHQTVLYNSIYLSDNELLVNQYAYGIAAANSPVLHLKDATTSELASGYLASFERIWASAVSIGRDA